MKKLLCVLCMALSLVACDKDDANTIKIGAVLPMTGSNAQFAQAIKVGIEAAIADKTNTKYKYKVIFEDGQQQAAKSVSAAQKLVSADNVKVLFSHLTATGRAIAPIAESANILGLNATLETENAEPMGETTFFQGPSVERYHDTMMRVMKRNNIKSVAIIAQNVGVSCPGAHAFSKKLNANGIKATVECFNPGERDFKAIINKFDNVDDIIDAIGNMPSRFIDGEKVYVLANESRDKVITYLMSVPNGIQNMSMSVPGLVETSLNLGILELREDHLFAQHAVRSSVGTRKEYVVKRLTSLVDALGGSVECKGDYPAWEYREDSVVRDKAVRLYKEMYGSEPVVEGIHAGLECGLLAGKISGLDCVSIGPDMKDIHTYNERLSISSTKRVYEFLIEFLKG